MGGRKPVGIEFSENGLLRVIRDQSSAWDVRWDGMRRTFLENFKQARKNRSLFRCDSIICLLSLSIKIRFIDGNDHFQILFSFFKTFSVYVVQFTKNI